MLRAGDKLVARSDIVLDDSLQKQQIAANEEEPPMHLKGNNVETSTPVLSPPEKKEPSFEDPLRKQDTSEGSTQVILR